MPKRKSNGEGKIVRSKISLLTVGDVAKLFDVSSRTVINWTELEDGLPVQRLPGGRDRRFHWKEVLAFAREHVGVNSYWDILHGLSAAGYRQTVLLVALHEKWSVRAADWGLTPIVAFAPFEAGYKMAVETPRKVVISGVIGRNEACQVASYAALQPLTESVTIIDDPSIYGEFSSATIKVIDLRGDAPEKEIDKIYEG